MSGSQEEVSEEGARVGLCYYITGHGYGHATRSVKVVEELLATRRGLDIHVVSSPKTIDFIKSSLPSHVLDNITTHERVLDAGAVQHDALTIDPLASLQKYKQDIHDRHEELVSNEVEFLSTLSIQIVCVDCTPIACRAASLVNCKVYIISNFTWDFIYNEMLSDVSRDISENESIFFDLMIKECVRDYNSADAYIRLPGHAPLPKGFDPSKILEAPLISRSPRRSGRDVREELHLTNDIRVLLLCFGGGHNQAFSLQESYLPPDWVCITMCDEDKDAQTSGVAKNRTRTISVSSDYYIPDLINASDCVLGKIGYGFVSECVASRTPLIYISRSHWAEEGYLQSYLNEKGMGVKMPIHDFNNGKWQTYILQAHNLQKGLKIEASADIVKSEIDKGVEVKQWENDGAAFYICSLVLSVA